MSLTVHDLARKAGVSVGTVSRVLNGNTRVSRTLRARVDQAIRETGYRPDLRARNLARGTSGCIAFVVCNRTYLQPFNAWLLNGVVQYCGSHGYLVVYDQFTYPAEVPLLPQDLPHALRMAGATDGVILTGTNYANLAECLGQIGMSYVLVGNSYIADVPGERFDQVRFDHASGGRKATEYLIQLGHKDIWYIGDLSLPWYVERAEGYRRAMEEAGLQPKTLVEGLSDDRFLNGLHNAQMLLSRKHPVTAIIGATNEVAYGAWEALDDLGLTVPRDVSVIGFDDEHTTVKSRPLTAVTVNPEEEGQQLARMIIAKLLSPGIRVPEVVIQPRLTKNITCAPAPP